MAFKREVKSSGGRDWRSDSPNERPLVHFFKIILPCIFDYKKLRIPNTFVRRYGEELSGVAKVIVPSGHAWEIDLAKDQSNIWFDEGRQKFVEHHSIRFGYPLVFAYRGCCNFSVLIFDMSACKIRYPCPCVGPTSAKKTNYGEKRFFNPVEKMEDEDSIEISGCKIASLNECVLKSTDSNGFGRKGKSSKRHNASAEQNLGMKRRRRCNSVQQRQNLKQFGDKTSEKFVKEVDAEIIDLEDARESSKEKLNYHCMSKDCLISHASSCMFHLPPRPRLALCLFWLYLY